MEGDVATLNRHKPLNTDEGEGYEQAQDRFEASEEGSPPPEQGVQGVRCTLQVWVLLSGELLPLIVKNGGPTGLYSWTSSDLQ